MADNNDNKGFLPNLSNFIVPLGSLAAINYGVNPVDTVAIQCLTGRSPDKYLIMNSSVDVASRYSGMKKAFNTDGDYEIFVPVRKGGRLEVAPLTQAQCNALVEAAFQKMEYHAAGGQEKKALDGSDIEGQKNEIELLNPCLHVHMYLPMWKWAWNLYGHFITCFLAWGAFGPLPTLAIIKWFTTQRAPFEFIVFVLVYAITQAYTGYLLDVNHREVCYVRVKKYNVGTEMWEKWEHLHQSCSSLPASPDDRQGAIDDLERGRVRLEDDTTFAVPVMVVKPLIEFDLANWLLFLNPLRQIALSVCAISFELRVEWAIAYAGAGIFQAHLQKVLAERFMADAQTTQVYWFRRLPKYDYKDVQKQTWIL